MAEEVDNIWARIIGCERPHMIVPFPRKDKDGNPLCELAMVVLTAEEAAIVSADAEKKVRNLLKDNIAAAHEARRGYDELYNNFIAQGLLFMCCKSKDNLKQSFFPKKEAVLQVLNVDELAIMLNHYYTIQTELGPVIANLNDDEMQAWETRLLEAGKKPNFLLNSCSLEVLKTLVLYLANQLRISQTSKCLPILQPENTSNES